jgi:hypothetical protein
MPSPLLLPLAAEESAGATPYLIAALALFILIGMLVALLAFGKGREHS